MPPADAHCHRKGGLRTSTIRLAGSAAACRAYARRTPPVSEPTPCATGVPQAFPARQEPQRRATRSEEHTSELQSLMRISYTVFSLKKTTQLNSKQHTIPFIHRIQ